MKQSPVDVLRGLLGRIVNRPGTYKGQEELKYWRNKKGREGALSHDHYAYFYTAHFGLTEDSFRGKRILDVGCGPRGSLEWADMAAVRVGLDPLAVSYRELGTSKQGMRYVAAGSEYMPFRDNVFDIICSFNSLDHVDRLDQAIQEIVRILAPGGLFLLMTELNHDPTPCEPTTFSWDITQQFLPSLQLIEQRHYEKSEDGMYQSIRAGVPYDHSNSSKRYGILSAKFVKKA